MSLPKIKSHAIHSDMSLFIFSILLSFSILYVFDIHWSFYPGNQIFPPNKHVFTSSEPYYIGVPIGTLALFLLFKLLFYSFSEKERAEEEHEHSIKIKFKKDRAFMGKD